jgi:Haem-binding domain
MGLLKKILLLLLIVSIAIQFIQPGHNISGRILPTDISKMVRIPDSVQDILKKACYDCHSNNTNYPWYSNIQPIGWLMTKHIKQGKEVLNFNEFGNYSVRKQLSKLTGIANSIKDDDMPLSSYKWMHKEARLTKYEKEVVINWAQQSKDSLSKNQY